MARPRISVPPGSVVYANGRKYEPASGRTTLPEGTEEYSVVFKGPTTEAERASGAPDTIRIYLPIVSVDAPLSDTIERLNEIRDAMAAAHKWETPQLKPTAFEDFEED